MGLFTNNKKLCPICGGPTPRLLATKIEGTAICKECSGKIDLPDGATEHMSMNDFRTYITYYEGNQVLRDRFKENCNMSFGLFAGRISLDTENRLFRLSDTPSALVMEAENLKKFRILEGSKPLFEGTADALIMHDTGIEERVNALQPQITQYINQRRQSELIDTIERRLDDEEDGQRPYRTRTMLVDVPVPFQKFHIELTLDHPYWQKRIWEMDGPMFDKHYPRIDDYLNDYQRMSGELHALALNLMQILNPNAGEITDDDAKAAPVFNTAATQPASAVSAVDEIKKYKELLDAGILTEEEFAAKKRQLLGI